jgi:hypothetical protein
MINTILHVFGWVIVIEGDKMYPARTKWRGFSQKSMTKNYEKIAKYIKENADELYDDIQDNHESV